MSQYNRRSPRAISTTPTQYGSYQGGHGGRPGITEVPQQASQQHVLPPQPPLPTQVAPPLPATPGFVKAEQPNNVSAVTKALDAMDAEDQKPSWKKKGPRLSKGERRKKMNRIVGKFVTPKTALMLLHEFRPNVTYRFTELSTIPHPSYMAEVLIDNNTLATGQGSSKAIAKNTAAENALKAIVNKMTQEGQAFQKTPMNNQHQVDGEDVVMETPENAESLPWTGLAAYAMYKLFNEWQQEGVQVPLPNAEPPGVPRKPTGKPKAPSDLPADAATMHPTALIAQMRPDAMFTEVDRKSGPEGSVTVSIEVDGQVFQASARNRKNARKEASKLVAKALYNLQYAE